MALWLVYLFYSFMSHAFHTHTILVGRKKTFAYLHTIWEPTTWTADRQELFINTQNEHCHMLFTVPPESWCLTDLVRLVTGQYQHEIFGNTQNEHCHMVFTSWCPIDLVKQADWWELFINPQHEHCHLLCTSWCPIDLARQADRQELRLSRDHLAPWIGLHSPSLHHLQ